MNYETVSDFEINKAVAEVLYKNKHTDYIGESVGNLPNPVQVIFKLGIDGDTFDYCNNPADAWPIINEHSIGLEPRFDGGWEAYTIDHWEYDEEGYTKASWWVDSNPLRCAMIVYLKMQESE